MSEKLKDDPPIIHCKVIVTKVTNPSTGKTDYEAEYRPKILQVTENDTILSFKLSGKTPDEVRIASVKPVQEDNDQLSPASISKSGKSAVLTDINTTKEILNLQFQFYDHTTNARLSMIGTGTSVNSSVYPEVDNEPPLPPACPDDNEDAPIAMAAVYPEVDNEPPLPPG